MVVHVPLWMNRKIVVPEAADSAQGWSDARDRRFVKLSFVVIVLAAAAGEHVTESQSCERTEPDGAGRACPDKGCIVVGLPRCLTSLRHALQIVIESIHFSVGLRLARSISPRSILRAIAPTTLAVT